MGFTYLAVTVGGVAILILAMTFGFSIQSFSESGAAGIGFGGFLIFGACILAYCGMHTFDLFTMPMQVEKANNAIRIDILYALTNLYESDELEASPHPQVQSPTRQNSKSTKICPHCAEQVQAAAVFCKHCRQPIFTEENQSQVNHFSEDLATKASKQLNYGHAVNESVKPSRRSSASMPYTFKQEKNGNPVVLVVVAFIALLGISGIFLISKNTRARSTVASDYSGIIETFVKNYSKNDSSMTNSFASQLERSPQVAQGKTKEAERVNKIGLKFLKLKSYGQAAQQFTAACRFDPSNSKYFSNLGFAQMLEGNLEGAKKNLFSSIQLAPRRQVTWGDLGETYAKLGQQDYAVNCFLIGYDFSNGDTLKYLQSLSADEDQSIVDAGRIALRDLNMPQSNTAPSSDSEPSPSVSPSPSPTGY